MTDTTADRPTYGNWFAQRSPGLFGAGLFGTVLLFVGIIFSLRGLLSAGGGSALVAAVAFAGVRRGRHTGRAGRLAARFRRAKAAATPPGSPARCSTETHPAEPAARSARQTELLDQQDTFGQPFAVIKSPGSL